MLGHTFSDNPISRFYFLKTCYGVRRFGYRSRIVTGVAVIFLIDIGDNYWDYNYD